MTERSQDESPKLRNNTVGSGSLITSGCCRAASRSDRITRSRSLPYDTPTSTLTRILLSPPKGVIHYVTGNKIRIGYNDRYILQALNGGRSHIYLAYIPFHIIDNNAVTYLDGSFNQKDETGNKIGCNVFAIQSQYPPKATRILQPVHSGQYQ